MEAQMVRRTRRPLLDVRESFETTRLGPHCLINAYARLVPVGREVARKTGRRTRRPAMPAELRGGEHV